MITVPSDVKIYLALGATDMRKSINGLSIIASEQMKLDIFASHLFVFCNRNRTILKILYWVLCDNYFVRLTTINLSG